MLLFILLCAFALPLIGYAQPSFTGDIVPECGPDQMCGFCDLVTLGENIVRFLVFFAVVVAILMFVYAGFLYLTGGSNAGQVSKAHRVFWVTLVGLVLTLAAWLIIDVIMTTFLGGSIKNVMGSWNTLPGCN